MEEVPQRTRTSIAIVDNDSIVIQALRVILGSHFKLLWTELDGNAALSNILEDERIPDVLLVDMGLADIPGATVIKRIRCNGTRPPILAFTSYPLERYAQDASQSGAQGIVPKNNLRLLADSIEAVARGNTLRPPAIQPDIVFDDASHAHTRVSHEKRSGTEALTYTELRIMELLARGYSSKQIATNLGMSDATARSHTMSIRRKYGVKTTGEALVKWDQEKCGR